MIMLVREKDRTEHNPCTVFITIRYRKWATTGLGG
jgi:hypothetical protein